MDWMKHEDFLEMLRRFPGTEIVARWNMDDRKPRHRWTYLPDKKRYLHRWDGYVERATESITLNRYLETHWNPEPFYHITNPKEQQLAVRLVEELVMTGYLEEAIYNCRATYVRRCDRCHRLISEGWVFQGCEHYCSDTCLLAVHPNLNAEDLQEIGLDDIRLETYWTDWD